MTLPLAHTTHSRQEDSMSSKKKLAARRVSRKRSQDPKPKGRSQYAKKVRLGPGPNSPFYVELLLLTTS